MAGTFTGGFYSDGTQEGLFGTDNDTNNVVETINSDTTTEGAIIDTNGFWRALCLVGTGTVTDGDYAFSMTQGDDVALSDEEAVPAASLNGTFPTYTADTDDDKDARVEVILTKRYLRLEVVSTNHSSSGAVVWAIIVLLKPAHGAKT